MSQVMPQPELLAPAGDWDAMRAAVANGADAVYFGLPAFNARHRATNFTLEELPEIMAFLHSHNVKGFIALNTLIFSDEFQSLVAYLRAIASAGVDAVIVQDLGVTQLIRRMVPSLAIHASTQMTLTEPRGIAFVEALGVQRVVLARELSLAEVRKIKSVTTMPLEVFIHGALCVAYSGQCLTSEALGGRSANRGQCAQACRLPYEMFVDGQAHDLGDRAYLLSPQDLAAYDQIADLVAAGVISFKIEGRLKGAPYVAGTTQTYRSALDAAVANKPFGLNRSEVNDLAQTFSRGFTPGFLEGVNHQRLVEGRFPKSRGVMIGIVKALTRQGVLLASSSQEEPEIKPGDGVVFDLGKPEESEYGGRVWEVLQVGNRLQREIRFGEGAIDFSRIVVGCRVWKTDDPALRKRLERSYASDERYRREPVTVHIAGCIGSELRLTLRDGEGNEADATWEGPLEAARQRPLTAEAFREQFDRLGETPFKLTEVIFELSNGVMVPKSVVNDLRRQVTDSLQKIRAGRIHHQISNENALESLRSAIAGKGTAETSSSLTVLVRTMEQLEAVLSLPQRPTMVYCDFEDTRRYREAVTKARNSGMPIGVATLRVLKPGEDGFLHPLVTALPDAVLVRNLGSIRYFQEHLPGTPLVGDFSLNIANELTANLFIEAGLSRLVPSYDLNWDQLASLIRQSNPDWYEPVIHQHMPMFHMEHCVFAAFLSTGKDFRDCGRPCDRHRVELRDRVGADFPVLADAGCRNTVFNSVAQSAAEYIARMRQLGLRRFRVELLRETAAQVGPLLERYQQVILGQDDGKQTWRHLQALNQLGVTRGTLQLL